MSYNGRLYYPMKFVTTYESSSKTSSSESSTTSSNMTSKRSSPVFMTALGGGGFSGYGAACMNWNGNMHSINY